MKLSAEELNAETLFPGDTIEYYSMAFVSGDPRGYRMAKVLKVLKDESEYPLRLDSQELLPHTLMIRRKLDRHGDEIDHTIAKWRKIRTFKLVTGEVQGKTRADRLNAGLKQSIASAYKAVSTTLGERPNGKSTHSRLREDDDEKQKSQKKPKQKPKHASDRFQQQQLSFVKRDAPAPSHTPATTTTAPRTPSEAKDKIKLKRSSLDSMSRMPVSLPLSRRPPQSPERTLKHKTTRYHASPSRERASQTPKSKTSGSSSKYFGEQRPKAPKKTALLSFVAQLEEKKSAQSTTLDEYLALDQKQKDVVERLSQSADAHSRSAAPAAPVSKWDQAKARFRAKQAPSSKSDRMKTDSRLLDKWLVQPNAPPVQTPKALDESSTPPRLKLKHKASPRRSNLNFLLPELERATSSPAPVAARAKDEMRDQQQRKRKRSNDFSSPAKRLKQDPTRRERPHDDDLMDQWVHKKY